MIAWFGPAVLLVLLAASNMPQPGESGGAAATAVRGAEEFGIAVTSLEIALLQATTEAVSSAAVSLPRELPRCRSVRGFGLPAPRAPTR